MQTTDTIAISDGCEVIQFKLTPDLMNLATDAAEEAITQCQEATYRIFGHKPPRLFVLLSADGSVSYPFSRGETPKAPWGPKVGKFASAIREEIRKEHPGFDFNAILVNSYETDNSSIGLHSDDEKGLIITNPGVIGVTIYPEKKRDGTDNNGELRRMQFLEKQTKRKHTITLRDGHLFIMKGETFQGKVLHGIAKETRKGKRPRNRVSFTFRMHKQ